jgi:hypothetical protein
MFVVGSDGVIDFDLEFLEEVAEMLDSKLKRLERAGAASGDPDQFGFLDRIEFLVGVGFTACQTYISATSGYMGVAKAESLTLGPTIGAGLKLARVVNAAANYWKHHEDGNPFASPTRTKSALDGTSESTRSRQLLGEGSRLPAERT